MATVAQGQTILRHGEPRTGLAGATGSEKHFKLWVPAKTNQVRIRISGGTGEADMYIRKGAQANTVSWSYRPYLWGNDESVTLNNPLSDTYYVMIRAYEGYTGLSLSADFQSGPRLYDNGGLVTNLSGVENSERHFRIVVPLNAAKLIIKLSGGSGDADLYVRRYGPATDNYHDYFGETANTNNETITVVSPSSGPWYLLVQGDDNYAGAKLLVEYEGLPKHRMSNVNLNDKGDGVCFTKSPATSWRYGYWGGPGWTNGREIKAGAWNGTENAQPIDAMDELFQAHDQAVKAAGTNDTAIELADQSLINGLNDLPDQIGGVTHPVWGEIWDSPTFWSMPDSVIVKPGSPVALPQVITQPTAMPYSEYARRQAKLGLSAGWFSE